MSETRKLMLLLLLGVGLYLGLDFLQERFSGVGSGLDEGAKAPDFTARDLSGRTITLSALAGKVVLLNFWSVSCPPCLYELPELLALSQRYRDRPLTVVTVNTDELGDEEVQRVIEQQRLDLPVIRDRSHDFTLSAKYGIEALPTAYLLDHRGGIARRFLG